MPFAPKPASRPVLRQKNRKLGSDPTPEKTHLNISEDI